MKAIKKYYQFSILFIRGIPIFNQGMFQSVTVLRIADVFRKCFRTFFSVKNTDVLTQTLDQVVIMKVFRKSVCDKCKRRDNRFFVEARIRDHPG